jgi:hypothetical protein
MELWEMLRVVELTKDIDQSQISTQVLDTSPTGLLHSTTGSDGAYLLEPVAGLSNYTEIRKLAASIFERSDMAKEQARIEIQNGTKNATIAYQIATDLGNLGLTITDESNTPDRNTQTTIIYDLTLGQKPTTVEYLRKLYNAQVFQQRPAVVPTNKDLPQDVTTNSTYPTGSTLVNNQLPDPQVTTSDIIIVIGSDQIAAQAKAKAINANLNTNSGLTNSNTNANTNLNTNSNKNSNSSTTNKNVNNSNTNTNANVNKNSNLNTNVNKNTNTANLNTNTNRNTNTVVTPINP